MISESFLVNYRDLYKNYAGYSKTQRTFHFLIQGVAKHVFTVWIEGETLPKEKFALVEDRQALLKIPSDLGRITKTVCANYSTMKADEWKHWTMVYSLYCLKGIIPRKDFNIWRKFVMACHKLCRPVIEWQDVENAHKLFVEFCKEFKERYGNADLVPNLHMLLHIKRCIADFGPIYAFWCFGFERYFCSILGTF